MLNKNINFDKNEAEPKIESTMHSFREINFALQLIQELQMKIKTVMNWSSRKKKDGIFVLFYLNVLNKLSKYIYIYISKTTLLETLLLLVFKFAGNLQFILKFNSLLSLTVLD